MTPEELIERLREMEAAAGRAMPHLLWEIGTHAVTYSKGNFRRQGFAGVPWAKRKKDKTPGRGTLIKSGHLRSSIHITGTTDDSVSVGTDVPYARIHNEGGEINHPSRAVILSYQKKGGKLKLGKTKTESQQRKITEIRRGTVPAYTQRMPKRQFLGNTAELHGQLKRLIKRELQQIFHS